MSEITRDRIERALVEFTGFKGDQAVIDALMVIVDAYAIGQAEMLAASPSELRRGFSHLLMQQAELLLDSAGRLANAAQLGEHVTFLAGLTDGMMTRSQQLADQVAALSAEVGDVKKGWSPDLSPPEPVPTATLQAWLGEELPDWERELIEQQVASRDRMPETPAAAPEKVLEVPGSVLEVPVSVLSDEVKAEVEAALKPRPKRVKPKRPVKPRRPTPHRTPHAGPGGVMLLQCAGCGLDLPVDRFFRNAKSPSGYESKCRACRKLAAV